MISGSAFQVSAADFFPFPDDDEAGAAPREWLRSLPMRLFGLPGSLGTMFFRCGVIEEHYNAAERATTSDQPTRGSRKECAAALALGAPLPTFSISIRFKGT